MTRIFKFDKYSYLIVIYIEYEYIAYECFTTHLPQAQQWYVPFSGHPLRWPAVQASRELCPPPKMEPLLSMTLHGPGHPKNTQ